MPDERVLQEGSLFAALQRHGVTYILIGGLAAAAHGSPLVTLDADIVPAVDRDNLTRLTAALRDLDARLRVEGIPDGVPFEFDPVTLRNGNVWTLLTRHGPLDICLYPVGSDGYDSLATRQWIVDYDGVMVAVADLADIIRSKEVAGRPKDRQALPTLRRLAEEIAARRAAEDELPEQPPGRP
jgi:hypothetical protein